MVVVVVVVVANTWHGMHGVHLPGKLPHYTGYIWMATGRAQANSIEAVYYLFTTV